MRDVMRKMNGNKSLSLPHTLPKSQKIDKRGKNEAKKS